MSKENLEFQTEVSQLLSLMIHSLYSNREIFLRELISNASDACDKLRVEALADDSLYEGNSDFHIEITFNEKERTLTISDSGVGMSKEEVVANLGTIAKSGTKEFFSKLSGDSAKDSALIGQFGVGFYSAFIVAEKVVVHTRRAGLSQDEAVLWESDGQTGFSVQAAKKESRGTEVTLHLRSAADIDGEKSHDDLLSHWKLSEIISKYSDHVPLPIEMREENDKGEPTAKWETINKASALWARPKSEIKEDEYKEFYKFITYDSNDPLTWIHNKVEGKQEYSSLLFIPEKSPYDLWNRDTPRGIKLFIQRVFIMDDAAHFLPLYLRFVKGVVDSSDLPLNVSREILQDHPLVDSIKKGLSKRVHDTLKKMQKDQPEDLSLIHI